MKGLSLTMLGLFVVLVAGVSSFSSAATDSPNSLLQDILASAPGQTDGAQPAVQSGSRNADYGTFRLEEEKSRRLLIFALISAALLSLVIVLWFLQANGTATAATLVNGSGLVLVIYATVLVVIIARADEQLTAAIGILGAIAGYLFGATTKSGTPPAGGDARQGAGS